MPYYEVEVTQTYRGRVWADNDEELQDNIDTGSLVFDSEELTDYTEEMEN